MIRIRQKSELDALLTKCRAYSQHIYAISNTKCVDDYKMAKHALEDIDGVRSIFDNPIYCYETNTIYTICDIGKGRCMVEIVGSDDVIRFMGFPQEPISTPSILTTTLLIELISIPFIIMYPNNFILMIPNCITVLYLTMCLFKIKLNRFFMFLMYPLIVFVYLEYIALDNVLNAIIRIMKRVKGFISKIDTKPKRSYRLYK